MGAVVRLGLTEGQKSYACQGDDEGITDVGWHENVLSEMGWPKYDHRVLTGSCPENYILVIYEVDIVFGRAA